ncbi:MAG: hypothetical protein JXD18_10310 [Anaerolineae bacterium]|nr:hypothetical protein [Anaerolineae bacterium]
MRALRLMVVALIAAVVVSLPAAPALADDDQPPGMVVWDDFVLESGDVVEGDLVIIGGNAELEDGSRVEGSVVVWGGSVDVGGVVEGDVAVFGGSADLEDTAEVEGGVTSFGGDVDWEEGAVVEGPHVFGPGELWNGNFVIPFVPAAPTEPTNPVRVIRDGPGAFVRGAFVQSVQVMLLTLLMAGLGGLVAVLWPRPALRVGEAGIQSLLPALGMGLLTFFVALIVVVGLAVTICLSPIAFLVMLLVGIAAVYGWIAVGIHIGDRIVGGSGNPFWSAALGAGLLTFLSGLLNLIPCIGWILPFFLVCIGLGAAVLTRFGAVPYPAARTYRRVAAPAPAVEPVEEAAPEVEEQV